MTTTARLLLTLALLYPGVSVATEEPPYTVEKRFATFEIRAYGPSVVAETTVPEGFDDAGRAAFKILAGYIFGNNRSKTRIAMTAPVSQRPGEKIAMTAPVTQVGGESSHLVQFTMPSGYTLDTLPEPGDGRVKLRAVPARRFAAYRYTGSWSHERFEKMLAQFRADLKAEGVPTTGEPIFARFNSPMALSFLRRNEIHLEVPGTSGGGGA